MVRLLNTYGLTQKVMAYSVPNFRHQVPQDTHERTIARHDNPFNYDPPVLIDWVHFPPYISLFISFVAPFSRTCILH